MKFHFKKDGVSQAKKFHKDFLHVITRDPYVDWAIIFSVSVLLAVTLVTFGLFTVIRSEEVAKKSSVPSIVSKNPIDLNSLTKTLKEIETRAAISREMSGSYFGSSDPGL